MFRDRAALDFGCGAGHSRRFLRNLEFDPTGIDISPAMLRLARKAEPSGRYLLVKDGDYSPVDLERFDLIFSAFAFDNIPGVEHRANILRSLRRLLQPDGRIVLLDCTPEIYVNETVSFTVHNFPENRTAKSGEEVRCVMKDVEDRRPVTDFLWLHEDYLALFADSGLKLVAHHLPLGRDDEPYDSGHRDDDPHLDDLHPQAPSLKQLPQGPRPDPLPWPHEQPASARWCGAQASRRPPRGADRQSHGA